MKNPTMSEIKCFVQMIMDYICKWGIILCPSEHFGIEINKYALNTHDRIS